MDACIKCELYYLAILKEKLCVVVNYIHKKKQILFRYFGQRRCDAGQLKILVAIRIDHHPISSFPNEFWKRGKESFWSSSLNWSQTQVVPLLLLLVLSGSKVGLKQRGSSASNESS